jgi:hypothetical protein
MSLLRIEGNHLLAPVVIGVHEGGRELLVVMSSGTKASEVVAERRFHFKQTLRKLMAAFIKKNNNITDRFKEPCIESRIRIILFKVTGLLYNLYLNIIY